VILILCPNPNSIANPSPPPPANLLQFAQSLPHVLNQGDPLIACSLEIDILPSASYELLVILFAYRERPLSLSSRVKLAFPITRGRTGTESSIEREERRLADVER
jgi:hypothetical protein